MPAITIFDDSRGAARNRPTSLPAEARSLSRMLRLLDAPQVAANALLQALEALPSPTPPPQNTINAAAVHRVQERVSQSILELNQAGWNSVARKYAEYHMALAVESVLQDPSSFHHVDTNKAHGGANTTTSSSNADNHHHTRSVEEDDCSSMDASSVIPATNHHKRAKLMGGAGSPSSLSSLEDTNSTNSHTCNDHNFKPAPTTTMTQPQKQRHASSRAARISDTSSTEESTLEVQATEEGSFTGDNDDDVTNNNHHHDHSPDNHNDNHHHHDVDDELSRTRAVRYIWATILESLHLQIASRTTRVWGRKKIYEIYQLAKPIIPDAAPRDMPHIQQDIQTECQRLLAGVVDVTTSCRSYTTMQPLPGTATATAAAAGGSTQQAICVQISLGKPLDLHDERNRSVSGEKKKKAGGEFVALLLPGSTLFALTASRAPSRSRFTPYILAVLENILTDTSKTFAAATLNKKNFNVKDLATTRVGDISGTEPCDLLRAARSMTTGEATGRFANMAAKDKSNPITDLQTATTGNLLVEQNNASEAKRLEIGSMHPGNSELAVQAASIAASSNGTAALGAASRTGSSLLVDHTAKEKETRKRSRVHALGRAKDCPSMQKMCWKWSGETSAASLCWLKQDVNETNNATTTDCQDLPKTEFKCAVVMKGEDVMQGIQALLDAGFIEAPLPDFLRDASIMGGTIRVDHGSFAAGTEAFEEV